MLSAHELLTKIKEALSDTLKSRMLEYFQQDTQLPLHDFKFYVYNIICV